MNVPKVIEKFYIEYNNKIEGNNDMMEIFDKYKLYCGRMINGSKISPEGQFCVWNANVLSPTKNKIWWGDLNITKDGKKLKEVAEELGETLYVLREMDCRFGTEDRQLTVLLTKAVWHTDLPVDKFIKDGILEAYVDTHS